MAVYALGDKVPEIHPEAYVHPDAVVIGAVVLGPEASVWPGAVLRGDDGAIRIGARTSVQEGSVLHCTEHLDTVVGDESVVGYMVHLAGCTVEAGALVGNGSVVLHEAVIRTGALVGSNAVVPARMEVPGGAMALGVPGKLRLDAVDPEMISGPMWSYVERIRRYRAELRRID